MFRDHCLDPILKDKKIQDKIYYTHVRSKTGFHYESETCRRPCTQLAVDIALLDIKSYHNSNKKWNIFVEETVKVDIIIPAYGIEVILIIPKFYQLMGKHVSVYIYKHKLRRNIQQN